jgi:hypothetical protein
MTAKSPEQAREMWAGLKEACRRKEWGDATAFAIYTTYSDEHGDFEVCVQDDFGQVANVSARCNVNDPDGELQMVLGMVYECYQEWQAQRYELYGEWATPEAEKQVADRLGMTVEELRVSKTKYGSLSRRVAAKEQAGS